MVSNDFFNRQTGLSMVCPITSTKRNYPLHTSAGSCSKIDGYIMVEQIRSTDYQARNAEFIEKAPAELLNEVLSLLHACL